MSDSCAPRKIALSITEFANNDDLTVSAYFGNRAGERIEEEIKNSSDIKICSTFLNSVLLNNLVDRKAALQQQWQNNASENDHSNSDDWCIKIVTSINTAAKEDSEDIEILRNYMKELDICAYSYLPYDRNNSDDYKKQLCQYLQIHAKFYIFDNERLYISSANYTVGGMRNNFEVLIKIVKKDNKHANTAFVNAMIDRFEKLYSNKEGFETPNQLR